MGSVLGSIVSSSWIDHAPNEIVKNLWLGPLYGANRQFFEEHNIGLVINLSQYYYSVSGLSPTALLASINLTDVPEAPISKHFLRCSTMIDYALQNGVGVYVHCLKGISRSTTIIAAYLLWQQYARPIPDKKVYTTEEILAFIKSKRPIIKPNDGFVVQLKLYEKYLASTYANARSEEIDTDEKN